jgi:hypothetical protein
MKRVEIDQLLDAAQTEAMAKGDESLRPGAITFNDETWVNRALNDIPTTIESPGKGIRYRGVRILIGRDRQDGVLTRAEAGVAGKPFVDLEARG